MKYQEVRNGEIIAVITNKSVLISVVTAPLVTNPNTPNLRITNKVSSGSINLRIPKSH